MAKKHATFSISQTNHNVAGVLLATILDQGKIKFGDVGVLSLKKMKPKYGFNPHTKKREKFPAFIKIVFTPSKQFKEAVQVWKSK